MHKSCARLALLATMASTSMVGTPKSAQAQSYPIDCAILLCLSGGWPASVPCVRARTEFMRRLTPWPVESPLQIWRCPMAATYRGQGSERVGGDVHDILLDGTRSALPFPSRFDARRPVSALPMAAVFRGPGANFGDEQKYVALQLVQNRADIDISGPEFDFVRSIRVFAVHYAHQHASARDSECLRSAVVMLGTYGIQGDFSWRRSAPGALPVAHVGLERWGTHCPSIHHRSVFVEWRDFRGDYGFEQVNY